MYKSIPRAEGQSKQMVIIFNRYEIMEVAEKYTKFLSEKLKEYLKEGKEVRVVHFSEEKYMGKDVILIID